LNLDSRKRLSNLRIIHMADAVELSGG
jgi:hypothetical protein